MRRAARGCTDRRGTRVPAGCLLAALALALLSLVTGARSAGGPAAPSLHPLGTHAEVLLRLAGPARVDPAALAPAVPARVAGSGVPYALLPTAPALRVAAGLLVRRGRRDGRSARPHRGVPTGRGPPAQLRAV